MVGTATVTMSATTYAHLLNEDFAKQVKAKIMENFKLVNDIDMGHFIGSIKRHITAHGRPDSSGMLFDVNTNCVIMAHDKERCINMFMERVRNEGVVEAFRSCHVHLEIVKIIKQKQKNDQRTLYHEISDERLYYDIQVHYKREEGDNAYVTVSFWLN